MIETFDFWSGASSIEDEIAPGHLSRRLHSERKHDIAIGLLDIGRHVCFGGKGGGSAPSPDPAIGQAALKNAQLGEEWLGFAKDQFKAGNIRQEDMDALTKTVINQQLETQEQASNWAQEDRARTKNVFQPLENEFIDTAQQYDSPEKQAAAAAEAKSDVLKASATQGQIATRNMASMGINPASGRFAAVSRAGDTNTALASAGAQNNARSIVRDKGLALKADAINMGKGLPSSTAAAYGIGTNAGNSAVGNQGAADAGFRQNGSVMAQGFGGAMQGYNNQGNILNNLYGNQVNAWSAEQQANAASSGGIGQMIGTVGNLGLKAYGMGMFSSKKLKTDKKPVDGALEAVNSMPIEEWKYKDGVADGGTHIGAYAEDFQKATGKGDGTMIPIVDAIGVTMKSVQELDRKVDKLARKGGK